MILSRRSMRISRALCPNIFKILGFLMIARVFMLLMLKGRQSDMLSGRALHDRLAGPLIYDDPDLIQIVKDEFLYPPSNFTYNLELGKYGSDTELYNHYRGEFAYAFCQKAIKKIFGAVKSGFFVEAGAIDGEYLSNTLPLELDNKWTGLLVEVDKDMFKELIKKNRKAWLSHCCLAVHPYPHQDVLLKYSQLSNSNKFSERAASAHGSLLSVRDGFALDNSEPGYKIYEYAQCIPLASLLLAIDISHVDLVSLDVEGAESGILENFPWDKITVDVWVVEHTLPSSESIAESIDESLFQENMNTKKEHISKHTKVSSPLVSAFDVDFRNVDTNFVRFFKRHGFELFVVSEDLFIPNYVFVRRDSNVFFKLLSGGNKS